MGWQTTHPQTGSIPKLFADLLASGDMIDISCRYEDNPQFLHKDAPGKALWIGPEPNQDPDGDARYHSQPHRFYVASINPDVDDVVATNDPQEALDALLAPDTSAVDLKDELKSDLDEAVSPEAAFIAKTIGPVNDAVASYWEGAEQSAQFDGGEWSSADFSPEQAEGKALAVLGEYGWEKTLEEYVNLAGSVLGWRLLERKYGSLIQYSNDAQNYAHAGDARQLDAIMRNSSAKDTQVLADEIKSTMGESIKRLVS